MLDAARRVLGALPLVLTLAGQASAAGPPDILGIQLGMPVRDAYAKLQAQLPRYKILVDSTTVPSIEKPVIRTFSAGPASVATGTEADQVKVDVTLPPNKQVVVRVDRQAFFPGRGIPKTTLLSSLRQKYGKESRAIGPGGRATTDDSQITGLLWLFDEQGHPARLPPLSSSGADPLATCPSEVSGIIESAPSDYGNPAWKWCVSSFTAVSANLITPPDMPELFSQMKITALSLPMASRAGQVTAKFKQDVAEGKRQQELEKAGQQEKPKL